jgi:NitT/TauT family transport system permease protein
MSRAQAAALAGFGALAAGLFVLVVLEAGRRFGAAEWLAVIAAWLLAWLLVEMLARAGRREPTAARLSRAAIPLVFGGTVLFLWEAITRGGGVPMVLLPPPSAIAAALGESVPILWTDFRQTFLKGVLGGYVIGCGAGFLAALAIDRSPFLQRGLTPVASLVAALPIIGIAPIMVMWFGFDWHSKAAVVVAMTFFPMLVNTSAGLAASDPIQRDLMRTYAAGYAQTLRYLRLPMAMPFVFNALKINTTLAMIGAIVAEFFGSPTMGMGFRISTELGRMNLGLVWAEIAVAALAGSAFYGLVTLVERAVTHWSPTIRR